MSSKKKYTLAEMHTLCLTRMGPDLKLCIRDFEHTGPHASEGVTKERTTITKPPGMSEMDYARSVLSGGITSTFATPEGTKVTFKCNDSLLLDKKGSRR